MDFIALLLAWIETHSTWAGLVVCVVAFAESLAVVGLILPGAAMMFGIGALVGTGTLELWHTLGWAALGAIAGDGVSFWLGARFRDRLPGWWPFNRHPELLTNATDFFVRHGGKSVLLGRFIGPMRPIIPAVAGMMGMSSARFLAVNVASGLCWAPVYVLPGMVFAATLGLAAEVATRLAVLGGFLVAGLLLAFWLNKRLFGWLHPKAHAMIAATLAWSRRHPLAGHLPAAVVDPDHPEAKGLTLLALLLLTATAVFTVILGAVGEQGVMANLDLYVYQALQQMRTPAMDRLLVATTELGDGPVLLILFGTVLAWLAGRRHIKALHHWVAAGLFALSASYGLKWVTALARPTELYSGISGYSFPSGHATHATVLFGFLAVLIGREVSDRRRWIVYGVGAALVTAVAFSRLYLGAHWLSDVIGGMALGLAWVALLGIAYRRHPAGHFRPGSLSAVSLAALAVGGTWNVTAHLPRDLERYAPLPEVRFMEAGNWWNGSWRELPVYRGELREMRRHPLTLQFAGDLQRLGETLSGRGWAPPPVLNALSWLGWLNSSAPLSTVPVLPQVHNGLNEAMLLTRPTGDGMCPMLALRFWDTHVRLQPGAMPLWIGNVSCLVRSEVPGMTVPVTRPGFEAPLAALKEQLAQGLQGYVYKEVLRRESGATWEGEVLLLRAARK